MSTLHCSQSSSVAPYLNPPTEFMTPEPSIHHWYWWKEYPIATAMSAHGSSPSIMAENPSLIGARHRYLVMDVGAQDTMGLESYDDMTTYLIFRPVQARWIAVTWDTDPVVRS
jgi:hypothetical protein